MSDLPDIPGVPTKLDSQLRGLLASMRDALRELQGRTGSGKGRALTFGESAGIGGGTTIIVPGPGGGGGGYTPDYTPPPTPSGVTCGAGIDFISYETDAPTFTEGNGYARTMVYGAKWPATDVVGPTFGTAVLIDEFVGEVGSRPTDPATRWCLWLKWKTRDGILSVDPAGGTNGFVVTTGQDPTLLLEILTGQITESQLFADLGARIDLIDAPAGTVGSVNKRIADGDSQTVTSVLATVAAAGGNIAINNSFESDANGDGLADGCGQYNNSIGLEPGVMTLSPGRTGGLAQRITWTGVNTTTKGIYSQNSQGGARGGWKAGATYVMSFFVRSNSAKASGCSIQWNTPPSATTQLLNPNLSTEWTRYAWRFTWGASTELFGRFYLSCVAGAAISGWLEFDDVQIEEGDTLHAYGTGAADLYAAVQTEATTRASQTGDLFAQYTIKLDVGGKVSGFGLASTGPTGTGSTFAIRADRLYIAAPSGVSGIGDVVPFAVQTTPYLSPTGELLPAGVYMSAAYIRDLDVALGRFQNAFITNAMIVSVSASRITAGVISVGNYIQSSNYVPNVSGWRIHGDGTGEFRNLRIAGTSTFDGQVTIRNSDNSILLQSGGQLALGAVPAEALNSNVTTTTLLTSGGGLSLVGNTVEKTGGGSGWNVGLYSKDGYVGGAFVSFVPVLAPGYGSFGIGLNTDPTSSNSYENIDFWLYCDGSGLLQAYESGYADGSIGAWSAGDVLAVSYDGSTVRYLKNGAVLKTTTVAVTAPLYLDGTFFNIGVKARNIQFGPLTSNAWASVGGSGRPSDNAGAVVTLINDGGMTIAGNTVTKTSGSGGWNSAVHSKDSYTGGAYVSWIVPVAGYSFGLGLNTDPTTNLSYDTIDFWWYQDGGSMGIYAYENGTGYGPYGTVAAGDALAVTYDGTTVRYLLNGVVKRSVAVAITAPLFLDSSFETTGGKATNIQFGPMSSNAWGSIGGSGKPLDSAGIVVDLLDGTAPGQRQADDPPRFYGSPGKYLQFKQSSSIGLPSGADYWATLETTKQYYTDGGGGRTTQYAFSGTGTWRRTATSDTSSATWTAWVIDLDRNSYTGDLNAQNNARLSLSADGILLNDGAPLSGAVTLGGLGAKALAFLDRITAAAASTYIEAASITLAHIKVASITTLGALSAYLGTVEVAIGGYLRSGSGVDFSSGSGFWLGWVGGEPGIKIGSTSAYLRYRPSTGLELKLDSFGASLNAGGVSLTVSDTAEHNLASRVVTPSGGVGPYTYRWSITPYFSPSAGSIYLSGDANSNSISVIARVASRSDNVSADVSCMVTDSNGRGAVASFYAYMTGDF